MRQRGEVAGRCPAEDSHPCRNRRPVTRGPPARRRRCRPLHLRDASVGRAQAARHLPDLRDEPVAGDLRRARERRGARQRGAPRAHRGQDRRGGPRAHVDRDPRGRAPHLRRDPAARRDPARERLDHAAAGQLDRPAGAARRDAALAVQPRSVRRAAGISSRARESPGRRRGARRLPGRGGGEEAVAVGHVVGADPGARAPRRGIRGDPGPVAGVRLRHREERRRGGRGRARPAPVPHRVARQGLGRGPGVRARRQPGPQGPDRAGHAAVSAGRLAARHRRLRLSLPRSDVAHRPRAHRAGQQGPGVQAGHVRQRRDPGRPRTAPADPDRRRHLYRARGGWSSSISARGASARRR